MVRLTKVVDFSFVAKSLGTDSEGRDKNFTRGGPRSHSLKTSGQRPSRSCDPLLGLQRTFGAPPRPIALSLLIPQKSFWRQKEPSFCDRWSTGLLPVSQPLPERSDGRAGVDDMMPSALT